MVLPEAVNILEKIEWPSFQGMYSMRIFFVLKRSCAKHKPKTGWDYRTVLSYASKFKQVCKDYPEMDESQKCKELVKLGAEAELANHLSIFSPLAYSKIVFKKLPVPETFRIHYEDGRLSGEKPLETQPAYLAAREIAYQQGSRGSRRIYGCSSLLQLV